MNADSPFLLAKRLEADVTRLVGGIDLTFYTHIEQQKLITLKHSLIDARLEIQDYELAETREHQLRNAAQSKLYLKQAEVIITENTLSVFSAVDVAHLSAQIAYISAKLK